MIKHLTGSEHHIAAAEQYERAAQHHRRASQHYVELNHPQAAHQALIAHGHMQKAVRHSNEATKYYVEQHGDDVVSGPPAPASKAAVLPEKTRNRPKQG
jgi:hypothetical protein